METYSLGPALELLSRPAGPEGCTLTLLTSEELSHTPSLPGLETVLHHTPPARDARVCKAELREYCLQVRELFQAQVDIRQNRIMQILTVVTTLCLPLSLVAGWYGMNFVGMPELGWKYGYPAVIAVSVLIVILCLWIMKKKKFW